MMLIDAANPVNRAHKFAPDAWWLAIPGRMGGAKFWEVIGPQSPTLGYHATLTNMADPSSGTSGWQGGPGYLPGAIAFDGSNDYANVGDIKFFDTGIYAISLVVDFMPYATSGFPGIVCKGNEDSSSDGSFVMNMSSGLLSFSLYRAGGGRKDITSGGTLSTNTWYQGWATWAGAGTYSLGWNGIQQVSGVDGADTVKVSTNSLQFGAGIGNTGPTRYPFNGKIASVRFYKRTFTLQEFREMYSHTLEGCPGLLKTPRHFAYPVLGVSGWGPLLGLQRSRRVLCI